MITETNLDINPQPIVPSGVPHGFDTGYAIAYGVDEAIMIRNFQYFISANANRGHNHREGRYWTYDRLEDFPKHFPYWTVKQIRRILASLVEKGVLIKGEFNEVWSKRTQWYAFKNQQHFIKHINPPKTPLPVDPDLPKRATERCPNGQLSDDQTGNCSYRTNTITDSILHTPSTPSSAGADSAASAADECEVLPSSACKKKKAKEFSAEAQALADKLIAVMQQHSKTFRPPAKPVFQEAAALLLQQEQDIDHVLKILDWACRDTLIVGDWNGWAAMVYSVPSAPNQKYGITKFCMKMDSIEKKMKASKDCKLTPGADLSSCDEGIAAWKARSL